MVIHVDGVRGKGDRSGDLCDRMSKKIRSQATELADLTERLQRHEAYSRLVETRLLELDPSHSLPVTPRDLDSGTSGGRNRSKRSSSVHEQVDAYSRRGARGGETDESMREGYHAAQERLKDAAQLIRQLREALASRYVNRVSRGHGFDSSCTYFVVFCLQQSESTTCITRTSVLLHFFTRKTTKSGFPGRFSTISE